MSKRAFITGISGQDGSFLAEHLLGLGYSVSGMLRRHSTPNTWRIDHIMPRLSLHYGDITDPLSIRRILDIERPDELYILAAMSHVKVSFDEPVYTAQADAVGVSNVLETVWQSKLPIKVYFAASSEMYGNAESADERGLCETDIMAPVSPYGCSKLFGYHLARSYRSRGLFVANGILFNHESERRGETFVTRKITRGIRDILLGKQKTIKLGYLDSMRDWGYAGDYVKAMHLMLQHGTPDDFVIATGKSYSVRDFLSKACGLVGLDPEKVLELDARYFRPNELFHLCGDATKANNMLGWSPKMDFDTLVKTMVDAEMRGPIEVKLKAGVI